MFRGSDQVVDQTRSEIVENDNEKTYCCDLCDVGDWISESEVEIHKRAAHRNDLARGLWQETVCYTCGAELESKLALRQHIKTVHLHSSANARRVEREIFICDHCHELFFNKKMLSIHMWHKHDKQVAVCGCAPDLNQVSIIQCPRCPKVLTRKTAYGHLCIKHRFQSVSLCPICLTKRQNRAELASHMLKHNKYYHCGVCGYMATKERDFNLHLDIYDRRSDIAEDVEYEKCFMPPPRLSNNRFMRSRPFLSGYYLPHNLFVCVLCRELCWKNEMKDHVARVHLYSAVESKMLYVCSCGEEYLHKVLLKHHVLKMGRGHSIVAKVNEPIPPHLSVKVEENENEDALEITDPNPIEESDEDDHRYVIIVQGEGEDPTHSFNVTVEGEEEFAVISMQEPTEITELLDG